MAQLLQPFIFRKRLESTSSLNKYTAVYGFDDDRMYNIHVKQVLWPAKNTDLNLLRAYDGQFTFWMILDAKNNNDIHTKVPIDRFVVVSVELDRLIFVSESTLETLTTSQQPFTGKLSDLANKTYIKGSLDQIPIFISRRYMVRTHTYSDQWGRPLESAALRTVIPATNNGDSFSTIYEVPSRMRWQKKDQNALVMVSMNRSTSTNRKRKRKKALDRHQNNKNSPVIQVPRSVNGKKGKSEKKRGGINVTSVDSDLTSTITDTSTISSTAVIESSIIKSCDSTTTIVSDT